MRTISAIALLVVLSASGAEVRVGVLSLFRPERITVKALPGTVIKLSAGSRELFLQAPDTIGLRAVGPEVDTFVRRESSTSREVRISARDGGAADFALGVPGKIDRRYRGVLMVTAAAGVLSLIVRMDSETAVAAAAAAEMPAGAPIEALKAMSVLARSYYASARGRHIDFDFCDTTHCQFHREPQDPRTPAARATAETAQLVVSYAGVPFAALYSASCGGKTRTAAEAGLSAQPYPYRAIECVPCLRDSPRWVRRLPAEQGRALLQAATEALRLSIVRQLGWSTIPSSNFRARQEGNEVVLEGRGEGHGVGACQHGAIAMGSAGAEFRSILLYYLPGTRLIPVPSAKPENKD